MTPKAKRKKPKASFFTASKRNEVELEVEIGIGDQNQTGRQKQPKSFFLMIFFLSVGRIYGDVRISGVFLAYLFIIFGVFLAFWLRVANNTLVALRAIFFSSNFHCLLELRLDSVCE